MNTFEDLITPLTTEEFLANHWEKTFLHIHNKKGHFSDLFSFRDIDRWLTSTKGSVFIRQATDGPNDQAQEFHPQEVSASFIYSAFARGCSLVLEPMDDWPPILEFIKALSGYFHATVSAKLFLIPEGTTTFPVHAAGFDSLVLQLEGEKLWNLHESRLLQINPSQKKTFKFPLHWYGRTKTPKLDEAYLKPGDALFIPRGMPYQAAEQKGVCLYLKINITPFVWMDFLKIGVEYAALYSEDLRKALPPGFVYQENVCEEMRQTFSDAMNAFVDSTSFDGVLAAVKRNRINLQRFPADGHFVQLIELEEIAAISLVQRRRNVLCSVDEVVDIERTRKCAIFFGNEQVVGPLHLRPALEFIRDHPRFQVSEIPGLDEKGQVVLIRRLVTEGLLQRIRDSERTEAQA